jgi:hypothetical protein
MRIQTLAGSAQPATGRLTRHTHQTAVRTAVKLPFWLTLLAISIVLPEEFSLYIFGLRFTVTRLLYIVLAPLIVSRLAQKMRTGRYRFLVTDLFVFLSGFWMIFAPANITGFTSALNHGGPIALEFCMGYFVTRVLLSERGQALKFISLFCSLVAIVGLLAVLDTLSQRFVLHWLATALTGYRTYSGADMSLGAADNYREGFFRAKGPFEHPIILGMMSCIGLIIASYVRIRFQKLSIAGCIVGAIAAVSTAPMQSLIIGFSLLTYNRILSGVPLKWLFLIGVCATGIGAVWISGHSILHFLFNNLIFDPASGFYRLMTWYQVIAAVHQSPWFGLGFGPFPEYLDINHSIDALWLMLALNYGVPGSILVCLSLIAGVALPVSSPKIDLSPMEKKLGLVLGVALTAIILISFTVDFWGSSWVACAVLLGVKAHLSELGRIGRRLPSPARDISIRRAV